MNKLLDDLDNEDARASINNEQRNSSYVNKDAMDDEDGEDMDNSHKAKLN